MDVLGLLSGHAPRIDHDICCGMQDYRVHLKHTDGHFEHVPYFSLPANDLTDVIAPSCYSCFDYPNALADLVSLLLSCIQSTLLHHTHMLSASNF